MGPKLSLEAIRAGINAQCIESLGVSWDERFGQLKAFHAERGHSNVTSRDDAVLATWVGNQRDLKKKGRLSVNRLRKLEELAFVWEVRDEKWEKMFTALREFQREHGHCAVHLHKFEPWRLCHELVAWACKQRRFFKRGKLSGERLQRLNDIGFSWDSNADVWEAMFKALRAYKEANGDCNVPRAFRKTQLIANYEASQREEADAGSHAMPLRLAWWVHCQRELRRKGKLSHDRLQRLDAIGFLWNR